MTTLTPGQKRLDELHRAIYGRPLPTHPGRAGRPKPKRKCDRCGNDTRRPDRCIDCQDMP